MKIIRMSLLLLFVAACNDNNGSSKKEEMASISPQSPTSPTFTPYNPPACPDSSYKELYTQPFSKPYGLGEAAFGLTKHDGYTGPEGIYGFPEPEDDPEQKKLWEKVSEGHNVVRGLIKAPKDGRVEISGELKLRGIAREIGLWIGQEEDVNQKDPIKIFNANKNSRFIRKGVDYAELYYNFYEIHASAPVKAGEKIIFKDLVDSDAVLNRVKICFKSN